MEHSLLRALGKSFTSDPAHANARITLGSHDPSDTIDSSMSISTITNDGHNFSTLTLQRSVSARNCEEIVRIMRRQIDDVDFTRECCIAIGDLAFADPDCQTRLGQAGACGTVVYGMRTHGANLGVGFSGLTAITALLLRGNINNVGLIAQAGGCDVITSVLLTHPACPYIALGGALAIHRLTEGITATVAIFGHGGGCEALVGAVRPHIRQVEVALAGVKAINSLACDDPTNSCRLGAAEGVELVIAMLQVGL